jgi:hypothetical protein
VEALSLGCSGNFGWIIDWHRLLCNNGGEWIRQVRQGASPDHETASESNMVAFLDLGSIPSASTIFDSLQTPNTFPPENPALGLDFCWGCGIIHA